MTFPLWRYGAYAFAIAATLCLAAANVAWAWSLDDGVYRYVMVAVSVAADIGAPCALMAMMAHQGDKDPTSALAAFVVWAFCGYAEIKGAEVWLKANSFVISAPAHKATEAQKAAIVEQETETANLAEIRKLMAGERREARFDALQRREKASLERIDRLRPQTFTSGIEPAKSQYVGNELALALALWLLSQVAWKMAIGRMHGDIQTSEKDSGGGLRPEELDLVRELISLSTTSLTVRPYATTQPVGRLAITSRNQFSTTGRPASQPVATSSQPRPTSRNQSQPTDQMADSQPIGQEGQPSGCDQNQPDGCVVNQSQPEAQPQPSSTSFQPLVGQPVNQSQPVATTDQPVSTKPITVLKLVETHPPLDDFQRTVRDMLKAGVSERKIAERLKRSRHDVRTAKQAVERSTTVDRG